MIRAVLLAWLVLVGIWIALSLVILRRPASASAGEATGASGPQH